MRYRDEVLEPIILQFAAAMGDELVFIWDTTRPHTVLVSTKLPEEEGDDVTDRSASSLDLNPINHC